MNPRPGVTTPLEEPSVWVMETALPAASTTHTWVVVDAAGNAVSMTHTLGYGPVHRLYSQSRRPGRWPAGRGQVKALEVVQHLQQGHPARRRSGRDQPAVAVAA